MIVYLVQHAEAKSKAEDPDRGLTPEGLVHIEATARAAARRGVRPSMIFHSGKTRAGETAEVLAEHLNPFIELGVADGLDPKDDPGEWAGKLKNMDDEVVIVGHLPHLQRLASLLICGDEEKEIVTFQNAVIVALERTIDRGWKLLWMITP